ncbi:YraN family protein [Novosphingobium sp.]|uniref:YraN family protein n=1 Tax=Novosphingobium sp. TaxID=1874826 RepID=UPI0025DE2217|nr:YraN family protein [Novosphingobium sp.]
MKDRERRERDGRRGEALAAWYLRLKGWRILARRVKTPRGEIDLIAKRGGMICFVEVKWRASAAEADQAIDQWRLRRVIDAAQAVSAQYARQGEDIRVDVLLLAPGRLPRHIVNASLA